MKKEKNNKNKVIPEICSREYSPCVKAKRLISPTEAIGDDGICMAEVPDYSTRGRRKIKAFTLIELLVVVLIIGILAAVALPQYQKAVNKTRAVQLIMIANHIEKIRTIHILAGGSDTDGLQNMGFEYPITNTGTDGSILIVQGKTYTVHYQSATQYYSLYAPDSWKLPIYLWGSIDNDKLYWYCVPFSSPKSIGREVVACF